MCPHSLWQTGICAYSLWQTGICVHTDCDKQGSVSTQFVTNRDLCPHRLWQTGICVHTVCDKQGSVSTQSNKQGYASTQFMTNRYLCIYSLWQTGVCAHILLQKGRSTFADSLMKLFFFHQSNRWYVSVIATSLISKTCSSYTPDMLWLGPVLVLSAITDNLCIKRTSSKGTFCVI
jgi:hypothetical protein